MSKRGRVLLELLVVAVLTAAVLFHVSSAGLPTEYDSVDRPPGIRPDYAGVTLPPNIAPLNFMVTEPGSNYYVKIHSNRGEAIEITSRSGRIEIPPRRWRRLLQCNRGGPLYVDIYVEDDHGRWQRFNRVIETIAEDDIDGYLVYRMIKPLYNTWRVTGIYQRNLTNFDESPVLTGESFHRFTAGDTTRVSGCVNCHAFCNHRPDKMTIGVRDMIYGAGVLLAQNGRVTKVDTKFGYTAWHPSGRVIAYSVNDVRQFFHDGGTQIREVVDMDSALAYYLVESNVIKVNDKIADKNRLETYPAWSPDGRYLYFCRAPFPWTDRQHTPPANYKKLRYDLVRIRYDVDTDTWGELETVLSAEQTGKSILAPRISPDGRFLLFCMCDYACFPIHQPSSDLYIMDLRTERFDYWPLVQANSDRSESWHCWSSNSRWIAFSSKRRDGLFVRCYLSYVDKAGKARKPLILPQKDPEFYDGFLNTYTVPELIVEPVPVRQRDLADAARAPRGIPVEMPLTQASPKAGSGRGRPPWSYEQQ